ncbi:IS110 family transposase [Sphingobium chlorophenolicum]|uniref:IS110 family transposase n=1 Tax=Sphingobium chlorophenolicum TaxID=46429 RepID=UPI0002E3294E|nr:transposase [Sphingobium chlorophenolicum]
MRDEPFLGSFAQGLGHEVRLIPPIYVKPFVKRQKNEAVDAAAIAEAALRPHLHYVAVKSAGHQARAVAFRTHQSFVGQRTQLINALRGHLAEFGLVVAQGPANLKAVAGMISDDTIDLPDAVRDVARLYLDQIALLTHKIDELHSKLVASTKVDDARPDTRAIQGAAPPERQKITLQNRGHPHTRGGDRHSDKIEAHSGFSPTNAPTTSDHAAMNQNDRKPLKLALERSSPASRQDWKCAKVRTCSPSSRSHIA